MLIRQSCMTSIALDSTTTARIIFYVPGAIRTGSNGAGGPPCVPVRVSSRHVHRRDVCARLRRIGRNRSGAIRTSHPGRARPAGHRAQQPRRSRTRRGFCCSPKPISGGRAGLPMAACFGRPRARPGGPRAQADVRRRRLSLPLRRARQHRCSRRRICRRDPARLAFHPRRIHGHRVSGLRFPAASV